MAIGAVLEYSKIITIKALRLSCRMPILNLNFAEFRLNERGLFLPENCIFEGSYINSEMCGSQFK